MFTLTSHSSCYGAQSKAQGYPQRTLLSRSYQEPLVEGQCNSAIKDRSDGSSMKFSVQLVFTAAKRILLWEIEKDRTRDD